MQNQIPKNWQKEEVELIDHGLYKPVFPQEWEANKLYTLASWINGRAFKNSDFDSSGLPILKIAEIKNGVSSQTNFTKKDYGEEILIKKGDILFPWSGTPETSIDILIWNGLNGWLNQHTFKVVPNSNLDKDFFYYLLKYLKINFIKIASNKQTTGLGHVTVNDLKNLEIRLPKKPQQEEIASILSSFDDKIEVNNKIAKTLEEIAQVLFKEWFVHFRFPGYEKVEFVDSEFGKIPKVWQLKTFGQVAINYDRKRKPLSNMERVGRKGTYPYYGATEIMDYIDEYIFDGEYLLIAEDGTVETDEGKAVLQFIEGKFWVNNHAHIIQGTDEAPTFYLYLIFRNISIKPYITGAVQLKLTQENLNKIPVIIPSSDVMKQFINIVYPMILKIRKCHKENQKLATLRDLLLPKLMKGEMRV